jgi:Uma2 family endonuclease
MTNLLEMPEVRELFPPVSVAEYHRQVEAGLLGKNKELIRGIIINKVSKSALHSNTARRMHERILRALPAGYLAWRDDPLTFIDSEPEPDVAVVRGEDGDFDETHPRTAELVVEVAVTSVALDRALASLYAENGVAEYWIVLALRKEVEVYRAPREGIYQEKLILTITDTAQCQRLPQITIPLSEIFP